MKYDISIVAPACRPEKWLTFYESIGNTAMSYEIVFVGPNEPEFTLPDNFRFIKSNVKPCQATEIAYRNATGRLVLNIADDYTFLVADPLDMLYTEYNLYDGPVIISCVHVRNGLAHKDWQHFIACDESTPIMPVIGLMSRTLFMDIGGLDRRFTERLWDCDIAMRIYAMGGKVVISQVYANEIKPARVRTLTEIARQKEDARLLNYLWMRNGKVTFNRTDSVERYEDTEIELKSQGNKWNWD